MKGHCRKRKVYSLQIHATQSMCNAMHISDPNRVKNIP